MRFLRRPVAFVLLLWYLPACTSYQTSTLAPRDAVSGEPSVLLKVVDGEKTKTVMVSEPWVRGDSLGGTPCNGDTSRGWRCAKDGSNWSVPLSSVVEVKTRRGDGANTGLAVLGVIALGALVAATVGLAAACTGGDSYGGAWC
jgi:hypothetical protein